MDDGGPSATAFLFIIVLLIDIIAFGVRLDGVKAVPILVILFLIALAVVFLLRVILTVVLGLISSNSDDSKDKICSLPERIAKAVWAPFEKGVSVAASGILYLFGVRNVTEEADVTEEEIRSMVTEGQEQGVLHDSEADMISNIFEFSDKEAQDIMTNRNAMICIDGNMTLKDAVNFMLENNNSRYPVYLDNIDHIIGVLNMRDAMKRMYEKRDEDTQIRKIQGLLRHPKFVPETRNVESLFQNMQSTKTQLVIVIDEYGQTAGLVSMEDILEEIVGNILDEYDEETEYIEPTANDDEFIIEGKTPLEDLEEQFHISFEQEEFETLNGLLISKMDRIPEEDEDFDVDIGGFNFKIMSVKDHVIQSVLVTKTQSKLSE
ncbi:MAG: hemolysin family protein [Butyrivibrio sp.]|nr:hemolysin family protein [Butyrivibrio sp.]